MTAPKEGPWMMTYTGKQFYPLDPVVEDIDIVDIAHALSMICRYGGHSMVHYSVAQHSFYVSEIAQQEWLYSAEPTPLSAAAAEVNRIGLWGLLHDASEAYIGDMVRPLKETIGDEYRVIERRLMDAIMERFGILGEEPELVTEIDRRICVNETRALHRSPRLWDDRWKALDEQALPRSVDFHHAAMWTPAVAEQRFLQQFCKLGGPRFSFPNAEPVTNE